MSATSKLTEGGTGASLADYGQVLIRQKALVAAGVVLGLLAGLLLLPRLAPGTTTYGATVRLDVKSVGDDTTPSSGNGRSGSSTGSNRLADAAVMERTLTQLGPRAADIAGTEGLPVQDRAVLVTQRLTARPVTGTTRVDLSVTDTDAARAQLLLTTYARNYVKARNDQVAAQDRAALAALTKQADDLHASLMRWSARADAERRASLTGDASSLTLTELRIASERYQAKTSQIDKTVTATVLRGTPTAIVGPVVLGEVKEPASRLLLIVIGLLLGLIIGVAAAFTREAFRSRVAGTEEAERITGLPVIARVPRQGRPSKGVTVVEQPFGAAAEGFMRTRAALELRGLGETTHVLAVLSPEPRSGKSTLTVNLGHSLARRGSPTVIVSGDLRRPRLDGFFGVLGKPGLAELLAGTQRDAHALLVEVAENLFVLPSGTPDRNPADLLLEDRMSAIFDQLREVGIVLVDTPPAHWSADAVAIAHLADASVVVARPGHTRREELADLVENLRRLDVRVLGLVLLGATGSIASYAAQRYARQGDQLRREHETSSMDSSERGSVRAWPARGSRQPSPSTPTSDELAVERRSHG